MKLGGRSLRDIARAPLEPAHYAALAGMARRYPDFGENLRRYLFGSGAYPYRCAIRTPTGTIAPTLYSSDDLLTANEIFCRSDYAVEAPIGAVVDVGSNIGLSALYFLTEDPASRVYAFEPNPSNIPRLRSNLAAFEDRVTVAECAVGIESGAVEFSIEPTGRYGRIGRTPRGKSLITVPCRDINGVLAEVLEREGTIGVLKVDIEELDARLVERIRPELLARIKTVYYETGPPRPVDREGFRWSFRTGVNRLARVP